MKEIAVTAKSAVEEQLDRTWSTWMLDRQSGSNAWTCSQNHPCDSRHRWQHQLEGSGTTVLIDAGQLPLRLRSGRLPASVPRRPGQDRADDNPPAKYDASGATVINIRLQKTASLHRQSFRRDQPGRLQP